jgi:ribosomal protein L34
MQYKGKDVLEIQKTRHGFLIRLDTDPGFSLLGDRYYVSYKTAYRRFVIC